MVKPTINEVKVMTTPRNDVSLTPIVPLFAKGFEPAEVAVAA